MLVVADKDRLTHTRPRSMDSMLWGGQTSRGQFLGRVNLAVGRLRLVCAEWGLHTARGKHAWVLGVASERHESGFCTEWDLHAVWLLGVACFLRGVLVFGRQINRFAQLRV